MNKGKVFAFFNIGAVVLLSTAINIAAQSRSYSGRATGVVVLGPNAATGGDTGSLPSTGGSITISTPNVVLPGVVTGPVISTTSGAENASQSSTTVSNARVTAGGYIIRIATASSNSQCICCPGSAEGGCTGRSTATGVIVTDPAGNDVPITVTGQVNQVVTLPNGAGTITFNEQINGAGEITVNAVHINITSGGTNTNVIIGSAYSDIVCGTIGPTPSNVTVAGRVLTSSGAGIAGATVTLTNSTGGRQSAISNGTGNFSVQSVAAGQSYTVTATHKSFSFQSQFISVDDEINDLEITANP